MAMTVSTFAVAVPFADLGMSTAVVLGVEMQEVVLTSPNAIVHKDTLLVML